MTKKTQIAKLMMQMTHPEIMAMAKEIIDVQSNAADDGADWNLEKHFDRLLIAWAHGLGSME